MNALSPIRLKHTVFHGDVSIAKRNLPVLAVVCIFSLLGAMYFGMFFARQEVLALAHARQEESVRNFSHITLKRDEQIETLSVALRDSQYAHQNKLSAIEGLATEIAVYLASNPDPANHLRVARLEEALEKIRRETTPPGGGAR